MIAFPPCKINLGLHVVRKRADGYHDIETCFYPVPWKDALEIIRSDKFRFTASGITVTYNNKDNIVVNAYELLKKDFSLSPVEIHLHKVIPHGAGLGGGSSDAAWALRLLNDVFQLGLNTDQLRELALKLGSDCPFFVEPSPMVASGRGEILHLIPLRLSGFVLGIAKPDDVISTSEAYAGVTPSAPTVDLKTILLEPVAAWKHSLKNDFEASVFRRHPIVADIKSKFYQLGALYSSMTGSGSSVFGLFEKPISIKEHFKGMNVWQGHLP